MEGTMEKKFWKSKKFWTFIFMALMSLLKANGVEVPNELFWGSGAYMGAQGLADLGKNG